MPEQVCQFFIRGRCQKEDCEFKHEKPASKANEKPEKSVAASEKSDDANDKEAVVAKKSEPPPPTEVDMTTNDTSTFIAASSDETISGNGQLKARRAVPTTDKAEKQADPPKDVRRDSKGFENFDDYFESDGNDTTMNSAADPAEKTAEADESMETEEAVKEPEAPLKSVPAPTENMPEDILASEKKGSEQSVEPELVLEDDNEGPTEATEEAAEEPQEQDASEEPPTEEPQEAPEAEGEPKEAAKEPEKPIKKAEVPKKAVLDKMSKEWDEEDDTENVENEAETPAQSEAVAESQEAEPAAPNEEQETIENIENFIEGTTKDKPEQGGKAKEEWVTVIFGEDGKQISTQDKQKEKSVYDMEDEDFSATKATPFPGRKKSIKSEGVIKIGNNTHYYTGDKNAAAEGAGDTEDDEVEEGAEDGLITGDNFDASFEDGNDISEAGSVQGDVSMSSDTASPSGGKRKAGRGYAQGRRKHNTNYVYGAKSTAAKTRRCGECEGCNREDCGKCPSCVDKPRFGGKGAKKQACIYRICTWKNPSGKRITPQTPTMGKIGKSPKGVPSGKIVSPAAVRRVQDPSLDASLNQKDEDFEPVNKEATPVKAAKKVRAGRKSISVVSPAVGSEDSGEVIKKGDSEYIVVQTGSTGLTGKYWSDIGSLPPRRRCTLTPPPGSKPAKSPEAAATGKGAGVKRTSAEALPAPEEAEVASPPPAKRGRKSAKEDTEVKGGASPSSARGRKRKATDDKANEEAAELNTDANEINAEAAQSNGTGSSAQRNISCLSDANAEGSNAQQREVVVECFAPYDDHRWVNIGKEKNGNAPDAVQYARALRPPYQLLSFLRIKGNCAKGTSCSSKNTMVFVVLEGEITVVIHNTQFTAKKGDSFYIPPKNYYNLINNKAREAELSLLQYQYSGPLPSVPAGSQSGQTSNGLVQNP